MKKKICLLLILAIIVCWAVSLFSGEKFWSDIEYVNKLTAILCLVMIIYCRFNKNCNNNTTIHQQFVNDLFLQFKLENSSQVLIIDEHIKSLETYEIENSWNWYIVNFAYKEPPSNLFDIKFLAIKKPLFINNLEWHFNAELSIENWLMSSIEIVSNDESELNDDIASWRFWDK